jgi:phosphoserine phosphatase
MKTAEQHGGVPRKPQLPPSVAAVVPLCVDLDGTLLRTDTLYEGLLLLLKRGPLYALLALFWLLHGRSRLKREVASRVILNPAELPYREDLVDYLRQQSAAGRPLYLVTATDEAWAKTVARHLVFFLECLRVTAL